MSGCCGHNMKMVKIAQNFLKLALESGAKVVTFRLREDGKTEICFDGVCQEVSDHFVFSSMKVCLANLALVGFSSSYQGYIRKFVLEKDLVEVELDPENRWPLILNGNDMYKMSSPA